VADKDNIYIEFEVEPLLSRGPDAFPVTACSTCSGKTRMAFGWFLPDFIFISLHTC